MREACSHLKAKRLQALRVPLVGSLAGAGRAALGAVEALTTTLAVHASAVSSRRLGGSGRGVAGGGRVAGSRGVGGSRRVGRARGARSSAALPDGGAGHGEGLVATVDAEVGVGVGGLVGTGELDDGTGLAAAATSNLDLDARDVVLGLVDVGAVDTNVLNTEEVLAAGGILGDGGGDPVTVVGAPGLVGEVGVGVADTLLEDLEPVARAVVGLDVVTGGTGHVNQSRAGVLHLSTNTELDADLRTGSNGHDLSAASVGESTLVATGIGTVDGRAITEIGSRVGGELDRVVLGRAGGSTDVLGGGTAGNGLVEEVVGRGHLGKGTEDNGELHVDG